jgi:hypothetical protein
MRSERRVLTTLALIAGLATTNSAWACPMCKLAIETDAPQPKAYFISIFFMLGMIGAVCAGVVSLAWWINRRETQQLIDAGYGHLFDNAVTSGETELPAAQAPA